MPILHMRDLSLNKSSDVTYPRSPLVGYRTRIRTPVYDLSSHYIILLSTILYIKYFLYD